MGNLEESPARGRIVGLILACIALGLVLRGLEARTSLWIDELHTLFVAAAPSASELNAILAKDTHTPLYYLAVQLCSGPLQGITLRWVSILVGMLTIVPLLSLARAAGLGGAARVTTVGLFCTLPFQIQWGAELRPYAWFQLEAVLLAWAAFTPAGSPGRTRLRFAVFALATGLGLYTHLFTALAVLGVGATRLIVRRPTWLPLTRLIGAGALGVLLFMPWLYNVHTWLFETPSVLWTDEADVRDPAAVAVEETPADALIDEQLDADLAEARDAERNWSPQKLLQVPAQTLVPRVDSLGGAHATVARVTLLGLLGLLTLLLAAALTRERRAPERELVGTVLAATLSSALLALVCVRLINRIPLQYFVLAGWVWPLLFGALVQRLAPVLRRPATAALLLLSTAGGFAQALGEPRENLRRGVDVALEEARLRDAWLTSVMWQPEWYESGTVFRVYAPDSGWLEPEHVPKPDEEGGARTIVVLTRNAPDRGITNWRDWSPLRRGRERTALIHVDRTIAVYIYDYPGSENETTE